MGTIKMSDIGDKLHKLFFDQDPHLRIWNNVVTLTFEDDVSDDVMNEVFDTINSSLEINPKTGKHHYDPK